MLVLHSKTQCSRCERAVGEYGNTPPIAMKEHRNRSFPLWGEEQDVGSQFAKNKPSIQKATSHESVMLLFEI